MQICNRSIRLFVSSTFNDMHEERDALCRFVFPYLEDFCSRRNIGFTGIDLRWGVTEEEVRQGKTIGLCLSEVDNCRPYFLGILGERYGWIPDRKLTKAYSRLFRGGLSITEAEIVYGALDTQNSQLPQAFFCLRHPDLTQTIAGNVAEDDKSQKFLKRLKKRIRESPYPKLDGYTSITAFSAFVSEQICEAIARDFPADEATDEYKNESIAHSYFAQSQHDIFTGRNRELSDVDSHFSTNDKSPLFVTGVSGTGKTAFLARWAIRRQESCPDSFVFMHFYGASVHSAQWENLAKRLIHELCNKFDIPFKLPDTSGELVNAMQDCLHLASLKAREIILVIDSVDLVNTDQSFGMAWLPKDLPRGVKMLLSVKTSEGRANMLRRGYTEYKLRMLQPDEQQSLIATHLAPYGKHLEPCHLAQILNADSAKNPLYLRVLLHELCTHATHDRMDQLLTWYLEAKNAEALFEKVIETCEKTYTYNRCENMTREALSLFWCARHGLTESELLSLLGVPRVAFSPLYLALKPYLVNRNGILNFAFTALRDAVGRRYLASPASRMTCRRRLATQFMQIKTQHAVEELPWLLEKTAAWSKLHAFLCDLDNFHVLWKYNPSEVKMCWKKIEAKTKKNKITSYMPLLHRRTPKQTILELATCFLETGYPADAEKLLFQLCALRAARKNREIRQHAFGLLGNLYFATGQYRDARDHYLQKLALCKKDGNWLEFSRVLGNLGNMEELAGHYDEALNYYEQAGRECLKMGFVHGIQTEMGNRGNIYVKMKKMAEASKLFEAQEQICRESGHIAGLVAALGNKGFLLLEQEKFEDALQLLIEQEAICGKIGDMNQLQIIYGNKAVTLYRLNRKAEALEWLERQLALSEQIGNFDGQQKALARMAIFRFDEGDLAQAVEVSSRRVALCRRHKARIPYAEALRQYAVALKACGRDDEAQSAFREAKTFE